MPRRSCPCCNRASPSAPWALASLGSSSMAWRYSAMAPSTSPLSLRALPRLLWARASLGSRAMAFLYSAMAPSTSPLARRAAAEVASCGRWRTWGRGRWPCGTRRWPRPRLPAGSAARPRLEWASASLGARSDGLAVLGDGPVQVTLDVQGVAEVGVDLRRESFLRADELRGTFRWPRPRHPWRAGRCRAPSWAWKRLGSMAMALRYSSMAPSTSPLGE